MSASLIRGSVVCLDALLPTVCPLRSLALDDGALLNNFAVERCYWHIRPDLPCMGEGVSRSTVSW